jgi:hypothetical protein
MPLVWTLAARLFPVTDMQGQLGHAVTPVPARGADTLRQRPIAKNLATVAGESTVHAFPGSSRR